MDQITTKVHDPKISFKFHFNTYKRDDEVTWNSDCGKSVYFYDWKDLPRDKLIFEIIEDPKSDLEPLASYVYTDNNADVGNYTIKMEVRVDVLKDLEHIVYKKEFNIEILPCKIVQVLAPQEFDVEVV